MADGICDYDTDHPHARNWLFTRLAPPQTIELCDEHVAPGIIPLLAIELGVEPGDLYGAIERFIAREQKKAERALTDAQTAEAAQGSQGPDSPLCDYCSEPLGNGESHVHAGQPNPDDQAPVP